MARPRRAWVRGGAIGRRDDPQCASRVDDLRSCAASEPVASQSEKRKDRGGQETAVDCTRVCFVVVGRGMERKGGMAAHGVSVYPVGYGK